MLADTKDKRSGTARILSKLKRSLRRSAPQPLWADNLQSFYGAAPAPGGSPAAAAGFRRSSASTGAAARVLAALDGRQLHAQVISCSGLTHADWGASVPCSSFVRTRFLAECHQTAVVKRSSSPTWRTRFVFDTAPALAAAAAGAVAPELLCLQFEVWHREKYLPDAFLGQAKLSLRHLQLVPGSVVKLQLPLAVFDSKGSKTSGDFGSITVSVCVVEAGAAAAAMDDDAAGDWATSAAAGAPQLVPEPLALDMRQNPGGPHLRRQLPAVLTTGKGSVYEEPCVVILKLTLCGLLGLQGVVRGSRTAAALAAAQVAASRKEQRRQRDRGGEEEDEVVEEVGGSDLLDDFLGGFGSANEGGHRANAAAKAQRMIALMQLLKSSDGGSVGGSRRLRLSRRFSSLSGGTWEFDEDDLGDDDDLTHFHSVLDELDETEGDVTTRETRDDQDGGEDEEDDVAGFAEAELADPAADPQQQPGSSGGSGSAAAAAPAFSGKFVHFQVFYGNHKRSSDFFPVPVSGQLPLDKATFAFSETRPINPKPLVIKTYITRSRSTKGKLLGSYVLQPEGFIELVADCEAASRRLASEAFENSDLLDVQPGMADTGRFVAAGLAAAAAPEAEQRTKPACLAWSDGKRVHNLAAVARPLSSRRVPATLLLHLGLADLDKRAELHQIDLYASSAAAAAAAAAVVVPSQLRTSAAAAAVAAADAAAAAAAAGPGDLNSSFSIATPFAAAMAASAAAGSTPRGEPGIAGVEVLTPLSSAQSSPEKPLPALSTLTESPVRVQRSVRFSDDTAGQQRSDQAARGGGGQSGGKVKGLFAALRNRKDKRSSSSSSISSSSNSSIAGGNSSGGVLAAGGAGAKARKRDKVARSLMRSMSSRVQGLFLTPSVNLALVSRPAKLVKQLQPPASVTIQLHQILPVFYRATSLPGASGSSFVSAAAAGQPQAAGSGAARPGGIPGMSSLSSLTQLSQRLQLPAKLRGQDSSSSGAGAGVTAVAPSGKSIRLPGAGVPGLGSVGMPWFVVVHVGEFWARSETLPASAAGQDLAWTLLLPLWSPSAVLQLAVFGLPGKAADSALLLGKVQLQLCSQLPGRECRHTLYAPAESVGSKDDSGGHQQVLIDTIATTKGNVAAAAAAAAAAAVVGGEQQEQQPSSPLRRLTTNFKRPPAAAPGASSPTAAAADAPKRPFPKSSSVVVRDTALLESLKHSKAQQQQQQQQQATQQQGPQQQQRGEKKPPRSTGSWTNLLHKSAVNAAGPSASGPSNSGPSSSAGLARDSSSNMFSEASMLLGEAGVGAVMDVSICVSYASWGDLVRAYTRPQQPLSFFRQGMKEVKDLQQLQQEAVGRWLERCQPPIPAAVMHQMTDSGRHEFNLTRVKAAGFRLLGGANSLLRLKRQVADVRAWQYPLNSARIALILATIAVTPSRAIAALLLWLLLRWLWRAARAGWDNLGLGRPLKVLSLEDSMQSLTSRQLEPQLAALLTKQSKVPNSAVNELKRKLEKLQEGLLALQTLLTDAAELLDRLSLLAGWADPVASGLFATLLLVIIIGFASVGVGTTLSLVLLWLMRPPSLRSGHPGRLSCLVARIPRALQE